MKIVKNKRKELQARRESLKSDWVSAAIEASPHKILDVVYVVSSYFHTRIGRVTKFAPDHESNPTEAGYLIRVSFSADPDDGDWFDPNSVFSNPDHAIEEGKRQKEEEEENGYDPFTDQ